MPHDARAIEQGANWLGGHYEVCIELGARDEARLETALEACWAIGGLIGCWPGRSSSDPAARISPTLEFDGLSGIAAIPDFGECVCSTHVIREVDDGRIGSTWVCRWERWPQ